MEVWLVNMDETYLLRSTPKEDEFTEIHYSYVTELNGFRTSIEYDELEAINIYLRNLIERITNGVLLNDTEITNYYNQL